MGANSHRRAHRQGTNRHPVVTNPPKRRKEEPFRRFSRGAVQISGWKMTGSFLPWRESRKSLRPSFPNCRIAAMLPTPATATSPTAQGGETRADRRLRLLQQLPAAAAPLLEQLADTLVEGPDHELLRATELRLRDLGQQLAAAAQAGLDEGKKRAT